jgi:hypothetical protein
MLLADSKAFAAKGPQTYYLCYSTGCTPSNQDLLERTTLILFLLVSSSCPCKIILEDKATRLLYRNHQRKHGWQGHLTFLSQAHPRTGFLWCHSMTTTWHFPSKIILIFVVFPPTSFDSHRGNLPHSPASKSRRRGSSDTCP